MSKRGPARASIKPPNAGIVASTASRKSQQIVSVASKTRAPGATYTGSRSQVLGSSSSRKGLTGAADTFRPGNQPKVQIYDDQGVDVTPMPLLYVDPAMVRKTQSNILGDGSVGTPTDLMSQASFYQTGTVQSASTFGGGPFTRSVFSQSQSEMGESLSEDIGDTQAHDIAPAWADIKHVRDEVKEEVSESDLELMVDINLTETETIWLLDVTGTCVSLETDEAPIVTERIEKYKELCKSRVGNDRYVERGMNTFQDPPKLKLVQTSKIQYNDIGIDATTWDMYDSYQSMIEADKEAQQGGETGDEGGGTESRPASSKTEKPADTVDEAPGGGSRENTASARAGVDSRATFVSSQIGSEVDSSIKDKLQDPSIEERAKIEAEERLLNSDELRKAMFIMERVVNLNTFQPKQASYRDFPIIPDIDKVVSDDAQVVASDVGAMLDKLWTYSCPITKGKNVSYIAWNKTNPDLLAVAYGQFEFSEQKPGLVCCWSIKNPEFPERIYTCKQGVTSMDFSATNPNLLAVGLYDGTLAIFNVRTTTNEAVLDSFESNGKHICPVWQLQWIEKDRGSDERAEVLVSISGDGRITQWSIRKGFECTDLMKMKRLSSKISNIGKAGREKKTDSLISRQAGGSCFDFNTKDGNIYLAGTEEGHIHKCSCSYNEQFLDTYSGHNGPVYKIQWSPFLPDVFLSCSGDWCMKLWHQDITTPILNFISSTKSVFDVCWSPRSSTVFACVNEGAVEVWDLRVSVLDPIIVNTPMPGITLTSVSFARNSESILVGDSEGQVTVYQLRGMVEITDNQVEALNSIIQTSLASRLGNKQAADGEDEEVEE